MCSLSQVTGWRLGAQLGWTGTFSKHPGQAAALVQELHLCAPVTWELEPSGILLQGEAGVVGMKCFQRVKFRPPDGQLGFSRGTDRTDRKRFIMRNWLM